MTSTSFIYFLQGFLELSDTKTISAEQLKMIKGHLKLAFRDDIDPSMGDTKHQAELSAAHEGLDLAEFFKLNPHLNPHGNTFPFNDTPLERC